MENKSLTIVSVIAAGLASLCCIGPLVAVGLGLGAFGAAAFFESLRPYLLVVTVALLGTAFYLTYRKQSQEQCPDGTCAVAPPQKSQKLALWLATVIVVSLAAFPYYSGVFWGGAASASATAFTGKPADGDRTVAVFDIEGMTCAGCAASIQTTLDQMAGVSTAEVSFDTKTARVTYDASHASVEQLVTAISKLGYEVKPQKAG